MPANLESVEQAVLGIKTVEIVTCPLNPVAIDGSASSGAYTAGDAMGKLVPVKVPRRGKIISATLFDRDDEGLQIDLWLFKRKITQVASEDAWTCSDTDILECITRIPFFYFPDATVSRISEAFNIGKGYSVDAGIIWVQAVSVGAPTIAAGSEPMFSLQIESYDSSFKEV